MKRFVIALSIAAMSVAAFAGPHRGPRQRQHQFRKMVEKLGLTDAQKQQLRDLRKANHERNHQLYADLRAKVREYRAMRRANDPKAEALRNEIQPLREQARAARKAAREQFRNVLTAQQRQQLDELRAARQHRND
jgi:Spy/CpxP family protein refolding chaperone